MKVFRIMYTIAIDQEEYVVSFRDGPAWTVMVWHDKSQGQSLPCKACQDKRIGTIPGEPNAATAERLAEEFHDQLWSASDPSEPAIII